MSLQQLAEAVEKAEAALTVKQLFRGVVAMLCGEGELASFPKCAREHICIDGIHVFSGDEAMVFAKSGFVSEGFRPTSAEYEKAVSVIRASGVV